MEIFKIDEFVERNESGEFGVFKGVEMMYDITHQPRFAKSLEPIFLNHTRPLLYDLPDTVVVLGDDVVSVNGYVDQDTDCLLGYEIIGTICGREITISIYHSSEGSFAVLDDRCIDWAENLDTHIILSICTGYVVSPDDDGGVLPMVMARLFESDHYGSDRFNHSTEEEVYS